MKSLHRLSVRSLLFSVVCLLAGCNLLPQPQADTVRHFTLSGPAGAAPVADGTRLRPVQLAGHLRNRAMAVRISENEVIYLEDVRWAEPLDLSIQELLRARLEAVGSGATVTVQVQRCELVRSEGSSVQLAATWSILPANADRAAARRGAFAASPRTWDGKDYGALVARLRDAVNELADAIVAALPEKK